MNNCLFTEQNNIIFHQDTIPYSADWKRFDQKFDDGFNYTIFVSKLLRQYLGHPYGECSDYQIPSALTYYATSSMQCYRKCIQWQHIKQFNCTPIFIDNYVHENDFESIDTEFCSIDTFDKRENQSIEMNDICHKQCPKDCLHVEYSSRVEKSVNLFGNQQWFDYKQCNNYDNFYERPLQRSVLWDTTKPMFAYIEEPVMTLTAYLVYCGGLMGLWLGYSAKDLIVFSLNLIKRIFRKLFLIITM